MKELPLRIIDQPGGPVIRCLCGAEAAIVYPAASGTAAIITANRGTGVRNRGLSPDLTPAAVLRMVAHVKACRNLPHAR